MREAGLQTERLSVLTDGVYAIAITLLVLDVKVPEHLSPGQVPLALLENIPKFVTDTESREYLGHPRTRTLSRRTA